MDCIRKFIAAFIGRMGADGETSYNKRLYA